MTSPVLADFADADFVCFRQLRDFIWNHWDHGKRDCGPRVVPGRDR